MNLKARLALLMFLGAGTLIGASVGVLFGFFTSIVGFDFGIWKVFWVVFWCCLWIGIGISVLAWLCWLLINRE